MKKRICKTTNIVKPSSSTQCYYTESEPNRWRPSEHEAIPPRFSPPPSDICRYCALSENTTPPRNEDREPPTAETMGTILDFGVTTVRNPQEHAESRERAPSVETSPDRGSASLAHHGHPLRVNVTAGLQPQEIDAARQVRDIELHLLLPGSISLYKGQHLPPQNVVDTERDL